MHWFQPNVQKTVFVERQKKYIIDYDFPTKSIKLVKNHQVYLWGRHPVRCRLLHKTTDSPIADRTVILHCHGGGFLTGTPDSHEVYLRGWAKDLPGVPIVSVDYSLSPKVIKDYIR